MRKCFIAGVSLLFTVCMFSVSALRAQDGRAKKGIPPAVQKTADEQSKGATVRGLSKEVENGKTQYELELTVNGHSRDMIIDPSGNILTVEEETKLEDLPSELKAEIQKTIGTAKLIRLESVTKGSVLAGYEATVSKAGKKSGIEMGPDGKRLPAPTH
jgi:hypothetical protein